MFRLKVELQIHEVFDFIEFKAESDHNGHETATGQIRATGMLTYDWPMTQLIDLEDNKCWFWWDTLVGVVDLKLSQDRDLFCSLPLAGGQGEDLSAGRAGPRGGRFFA
jgi:hypothetical protein